MGIGLRYSPLRYKDGAFDFGGTRALGLINSPVGHFGGTFYLVTSKSSDANEYYDRLRVAGVPDGDIYTALGSAYSACISGRNDVVVVTPGAHATTSSLSWDKHNTHIIGMGGPNIGGDYSEPNAVLYTSTSAQGYVLDIDAHNCIFEGITIENAGNSATNYAAVKLNGYGNTFRYCQIAGQMGATAAATAACASLYIHGAGMYPLFENCQIGQDVWSNRSGANGGVIRFSGAGRPNGGTFTNCRITSVSSTATTALVAIPDATYSGRGWLFDNCVFHNFDGTDANGTNTNQAFYTVTGTQMKTMLLHNCSLFGVDEWQDGGFTVVHSTMPVASNQGGLGCPVTEYFGE